MKTMTSQEKIELLESLANAAKKDYRRAKEHCFFRRKNDDTCKMYLDRGGTVCGDCPVEWVSTIEEAIKKAVFE